MTSLPRFAAHYLDGILIAEIVAALDSVEGVVSPIVSPVRQRRVDPALRRVRVAAHRMDLGDNGDIYTAVPGRESGSHAGESGADYQYIVVEQAKAFSQEIS